MEIQLTQSEAGIAVNGSTRLNCGCSSRGPMWAFLGEGFLDRPYAYSQGCVQHDVSALRATSRKEVPLKSDERVLFQRGTTVEGIQFQGFRIPTITRLKNGSLYASAEARYGRKPAAGRGAVQSGAVQSYPSVLVSCCNAELCLAAT